MNTPAVQNQQRLPGLIYLLYLLGILFGITAVIGVIITHTHIHKTRGSYAHSHLLWQIISFWSLLAGAATSFALWPGDMAMAIALISLLWWLSTLLIGCIFLALKKPVPFVSKICRINPQSKQI